LTPYVQQSAVLQCFPIHKSPENQYDQTTEIINVFIDTFLAQSELAIVLLDQSGGVVDISMSACRIFSIHRQHARGCYYEHVFSHIPIERRYLFGDAICGKNGKEIPFSWSNQYQNYELLIDIHHLFSDDGRQIGAYLIFNDVTHMRQLEHQIRRSDRLAMIGQVAASAAHEIRNPLTSIKGFLQLLQHTLNKSSHQREITYTEIMLTEIERINHLVGEFLVLSKPKSTVLQPVSLMSIVEEIIPIIESESRLHDITVGRYLSGVNVTVLADREQLKQVILNLCKNGIEAMSEQGKQLILRERINYHENSVALEIHDQGSGIPPFLIDKIFDPFFTTKDSGTGLGLSICKRIIQDIGGQIRVTSRDNGTVMTIVLPVHST
jgi:two-component system, sporulation sensor kinase E